MDTLLNNLSENQLLKRKSELELLIKNNDASAKEAIELMKIRTKLLIIKNAKNGKSIYD